jgi:hypothetical protein
LTTARDWVRSSVLHRIDLGANVRRHRASEAAGFQSLDDLRFIENVAILCSRASENEQDAAEA